MNLCNNNNNNNDNVDNNNYHLNNRPKRWSTKNVNDKKPVVVNKTAAELLEASKRLYVKSEEVLEKRQEWKIKKVSSFPQSTNNNYCNKYQIISSFSFDREFPPEKLSPPPIPPKTGRILNISRNSSSNLSKPPIPPKPKKMDNNDQLLARTDQRQSREDLKNCFISLIAPNGTVENLDEDENLRESMGSSPNLHNSSSPLKSDAQAPSKKIAYSKRRKSMPNLAGIGQISACSFDDSVEKANEDEASTVGADDGSSSARWDISVRTCVDNQSDISACESLTSSPRRQSNCPPPLTKRMVSLSSTESDGQISRHLESDGQISRLGSDAQVVPPPVALHKFFNSMGLEKNVWQKMNQDEIETVQYFSTVSSVPSSVTFSKSSDSNSNGRRRSTASTNADQNNKQISIIERNARVIKWIYACGEND